MYLSATVITNAYCYYNSVLKYKIKTHNTHSHTHTHSLSLTYSLSSLLCHPLPFCHSLCSMRTARPMISLNPPVSHTEISKELSYFTKSRYLTANKNIRRAQVKVGLINLCKVLFSLNARIYYKLKSGT